MILGPKFWALRPQPQQMITVWANSSGSPEPELGASPAEKVDGLSSLP